MLPFRIQQLLTSSPDGHQILALSLGIGENLPSFLQIDLTERTVQNLGYSNTLYQVAFRSPKTGVSVISFEDVSTDQGWDLVLADDKGHLLKDLQARKQDDILPAWQPDGKSHRLPRGSRGQEGEAMTLRRWLVLIGFALLAIPEGLKQTALKTSPPVWKPG